MLFIIPMDAKVNILIDGGFFKRKYKELTGEHADADAVVKEVSKIMQAIQEKSGDTCRDILFRVYYYDCNPFGGKAKNPDTKEEVDFSANRTYEFTEKMLKDLKQQERFAVRLGELSFDGWEKKEKTDKNGNVATYHIPKLRQKGVDMKVGLDMALMALKHLVEKVVLVAGDSDFIAPMKFARKEGLLVYLYSMGHRIKSQLTEHCDYKLS